MQALDESFGAQLGEVVSKRGESVIVGSSTEGFRGIDVNFGSGEAVLCRDVRKADEGLHQCQLSGMIELEPRDTFTIGQNRGLGEFKELSAVDERFQDVLLDVVIPVDDC